MPLCHGDGVRRGGVCGQGGHHGVIISYSMMLMAGEGRRQAGWGRGKSIACNNSREDPNYKYCFTETNKFHTTMISLDELVLRNNK